MKATRIIRFLTIVLVSVFMQGAIELTYDPPVQTPDEIGIVQQKQPDAPDLYACWPRNTTSSSAAELWLGCASLIAELGRARPARAAVCAIQHSVGLAVIGAFRSLQIGH